MTSGHRRFSDDGMKFRRYTNNGIQLMVPRGGFVENHTFLEQFVRMEVPAQFSHWFGKDKGSIMKSAESGGTIL